MKINGFKLIDGGRRGMSVVTSENVVKDGTTIVDDVTRVRPVPVSDKLKRKVQELKKGYMRLLMYWEPEFDALYDDEKCEAVKMVEGLDSHYERLVHLLQCVQVNGIKIVGSRFMIMGQVVVSDGGLVVSPTIPLMGAEDTDFYDEVWDKIIEVKKAVKEYLDSASMDFNARQYLLPLYKSKEEELESMTDEEAEANAISLLQDKGFVVVSQGDVMGLDGDDNVGLKDNVLPAMSAEVDEEEMPKKSKKVSLKDKFTGDSF
jgi:hypothetical protein